MASQVIQCTQACEVTVLFEPAPASSERLADYGTLFGLLLVALVVVGCFKALKNLFWSDSDGR